MVNQLCSGGQCIFDPVLHTPQVGIRFSQQICPRHIHRLDGNHTQEPGWPFAGHIWRQPDGVSLGEGERPVQGAGAGGGGGP